MEDQKQSVMSCQQVVRSAGDYCDGLLAEPERLRIEAHTDGCTACREFLATYGATGRIYRKHLVRRLPPEVQSTFWKFLEEHLHNEE